jgi:hypothetical protein
MAETIVGAWTPLEPINPEAKEIFEELKFPLGVAYQPLLFAKQLVNGLNWLFIANAHAVYPGATTYPVEILAYQPPGQKPHVQTIIKMPR